MTVWWLLLPVLAISWGLTLVLRRYALSKSLMDVPNERSSHKVATPRGGGLAIVVSFLLSLPVLESLSLMPAPALYSLLGSGGLVAVIGFADDHGHIAARWRLLGHFVAALWALYWLNGLPPVILFGITVDMGWFGTILALIYLVWMLNLYNFMDGIDGIASVEAITVCLGMCVVYWAIGNLDLVAAPLMLSVAVAGFFFWNFPPAKIFMGDVGSGFLGMIFGGLAIQASWSDPKLMWSWIILLGVFIVDSTWTLLSRLINGKKIYEAHCTHGYQHASKISGSHLKVTLCVMLINLLWLLPISIGVGTGGLDGASGLLLSWIPLFFLAFRFRSGKD
ncbi:MraY family glycosyltransferase [Pseudomonas rhizophila]